MSGPDHHRKYPRIKKILFSAVKRYDDDGELSEGYTGKTLNISEGGVLIESGNPLPLRTHLDVVLGMDDNMLKLKGEVVHLEQKGEDAVDMGVMFLGLDEEKRKALKRALRLA